MPKIGGYIIEKNMDSYVVKNDEYTFDDLFNHKIGTVYRLWKNDYGLYGLILRGHASLCAYVGVPVDLANMLTEYFDEIHVHGGVTFRGTRDSIIEGVSDYHWIGWDYAHYNDQLLIPNISSVLDGHKWTIPEVEKEIIIIFKEIEEYVKKCVEITLHEY